MQAPRQTGKPARYRVAVASDATLVTECVRAALTNRGFDAQVLDWPAPDLSDAHPPRVDLGLVLCDLNHSTRVREVRTLTTRFRVPWLLLTGTPRGPVWGSVLDGGVSVVLPTSTTLEDLTPLLHAIGRGDTLMAWSARMNLIREWSVMERDRERRVQRMRSLTPREKAALVLLHEGRDVRTIARLFDVKEATVRSQVRAVLHKLGVNSQLAAVAAFEYLEEDDRDMDLSG